MVKHTQTIRRQIAKQKYKGMVELCSCNILGFTVFMCTSYDENISNFY